MNFLLVRVRGLWRAVMNRRIHELELEMKELGERMSTNETDIQRLQRENRETREAFARGVVVMKKLKAQQDEFKRRLDEALANSDPAAIRTLADEQDAMQAEFDAAIAEVEGTLPTEEPPAEV